MSSDADTSGDFVARRSRIPVRRIGMMLGVARERRGLSRHDVAQRTSWKYGPGILAQVEDGRHLMPVAEIPALAEAYEVDLDDILPDRVRLEVDLRKGRLRVGRASTKVPRGIEIGDLVPEYLSFVRSMRRLPDDAWIDPASLRLDDIVELAEATGTEPVAVERRIVEILDATRPEDDGEEWTARLAADALPPEQRPELYW